jgi:hypothetical protein
VGRSPKVCENLFGAVKEIISETQILYAGDLPEAAQKRKSTDHLDFGSAIQETVLMYAVGNLAIPLTTRLR